MQLKQKEIFTERRDEQDRRAVNLTLLSKNSVERRKRPDRRLAGLNVDMYTLSDAEFAEMFDDFLN